MPRELLKRIDLDLLYPPFLEKLLEVLAACKARNAHYVGYMGFRSWAEQHQLRQAFLNGKGGRAAPAGSSAHNYGLAVDLVLDKEPTKAGLQADWSEKAYDILIEEVTRHGLHSGAGYADRPHVALPGYETAAQLRPLQEVYRKFDGDRAAKLKAVWDTLTG